MILARTKNEFKRAAYCAVQMIQNVSKNRSNKKITLKDLQNITRAWTIMVPVAKKIVDVSNNLRLTTSLILVKGTGNDKCTVQWFADAEQYNSTSIGNFSCTEKGSKISRCESSLAYRYNRPVTITIKTPLNSTSVYDDLHITNNKIKAVLEVNLYNNAPNNEDNIAKFLGLRILKPKIPFRYDHSYIFFTAHVIFIPINGIFDENNPPS